MIERRKGTYVAAKYDETSCHLLSAWMHMWQIPNPVPTDKLHSTVVYSRAPLSIDKQLFFQELIEQDHKVRDWRATPTGFAFFQSSSSCSKRDVLVLLLDCPFLYDLHDDLIEMGATHDFDTYEPHVTLSYGVPENFDVKRLVLPPIFFTVEKINFEPLDVNWKDK